MLSKRSGLAGAILHICNPTTCGDLRDCDGDARMTFSDPAVFIRRPGRTTDDNSVSDKSPLPDSAGAADQPL
jgi:hypothetical protein